jgi:hypothetical protein
MHQPLHAGQEADRGGNLTCTAWMGEPSHLIDINGQKKCSGENLHVVWDSKILAVRTGGSYPDNITALSRGFARLLPPVQAAEPALKAHTAAEWRTVVERWHSETQALILQMDIYPHGNVIDDCYVTMALFASRCCGRQCAWQRCSSALSTHEDNKTARQTGG